MAFNHNSTALSRIVCRHPCCCMEVVDECAEHPDRGATIENYTFSAIYGKERAEERLEIGGVASTAFDVDIY